MRQFYQPDDKYIEAFADRHVHVDEAQRSSLEQVGPNTVEDAHESDRDLPSLRITRRDLERYDYTGSCRRCAEIQLGNFQTEAHHSTLCSARTYSCMSDSKDPKLERWLRGTLDANSNGMCLSRMSSN